MSRLKWSLGPQATMNFGLVLVVLILNSIVVHRNTIGLHTRQQATNRTHEVLQRIQSLFSSLSDAESSARGYASTRDESFLAVYQPLVEQLPAQLRELRDAAAENPLLSDRLHELGRLLDSRLSQLGTLVALPDLEAAKDKIRSGGGKENMEQVRKVIADLEREENRVLGIRDHEQNYGLFIVLTANFAAVTIGATITIAAWCLVERELRKRRLAESSAHSERQNLWVTLTSIGDGVIVTDAKGHVKLANPIARELIGSQDEILGRPLTNVFRILNEATREHAEDPVTQVLARQKVTGLSNHTVLLRDDGTEIPIEDNAAPIRDTSGQITGVVLVFRDCSARRQYEREMNARERRFRSVFETPLIGIAVGTAQGFLLEANDVYLDLIGYRRGELAESALSWGGVPAGQSPLDDGAQLELREKGVCRPFERTYTRTDGTRVPVLVSAARLLDEQDRIVVFVTDLSQSKRAEAALRESEARFRVLSECMPQKVWTAQADGQFDYLNHMLLEYAGRTPDQLSGWGWTNLIHPDDVPAYLRSWNQSLATGEMFEIEHRFRKHTGDFRWHLARAVPMYNPDSQIAMWVGTHTDIHDHKQAEEALREEHRRKDQFLALLAHELRNPLAPLSNAIAVFPSVQHDVVSSGELLGIMHRQVRQMTRLIDDLLDLARITTGRMRLRRERTVVKAVISAAVEAVQPIILEREHHLTVSIPTEELWLDADSARLAQILTNLLHNAAKYTDPQGQINLTVERADHDALFRIQDNGPGISKEMLNKIFDLFTQVELTLDRAHGGLGIGLTLVRTLVELHGGTVTASSDGLGHGSEFIVRLPILDPQRPEASTANSSDVNPPVEAPLAALRVLVVDDVKASAKTLAMMLKSLGQQAEVAFDGPSALGRVKEQCFDLVFLDIAMPGMDGLEVARQLRRSPEGNSLTLVALTGFGQDEDRAHSLKAGFNDHLTKPTSLDLLKGILKRVAASNGR
jgi:PAS domain S-box-containing protein